MPPWQSVSNGSARFAAARTGSTCQSADAVSPWRCEPLVRHFAAALHAFRPLDLDAAHASRAGSELASRHVGARNGMAKTDSTRRTSNTQGWPGSWLIPARSWWRPSGRLTPGEDSLIRHYPRSERPGRRLPRLAPGRGACGSRSQAGASTPRPASLYRKSLDIAADLPDALAGLSRCPPDAPTGLEMQVLGTGPAFLDAPSAGRPGAAHLRCNA